MASEVFQRSGVTGYREHQPWQSVRRDQRNGALRLICLGWLVLNRHFIDPHGGRPIVNEFYKKSRIG